MEIWSKAFLATGVISWIVVMAYTANHHTPAANLSIAEGVAYQHDSVDLLFCGEDSETLNSGSGYVFSYGNGEEGGANRGFIAPVAMRLVALTVGCETSVTGTAVIALHDDGAEVGTVTIADDLTAYTTIGDNTIAVGSAVTFYKKTNPTGGGEGATPCAILRYKKDEL